MPVKKTGIQSSVSGVVSVGKGQNNLQRKKERKTFGEGIHTHSRQMFSILNFVYFFHFISYFKLYIDSLNFCLPQKEKSKPACPLSIPNICYFTLE